MKRKETIFLGIISIIIILGVLVFWFTKTTPTESEIDGITSLVKPADRNIFTNKTAEKLKELTIYGNIPVEVQDNYNNRDPFF